LLENGAKINVGSGNNLPVLYLAAKSRNLEMTKLLIQHGATFDDGEFHDRPNAIMQVVKDNNESILKASIIKSLS
jgi:ankyrin repeat protein